MPRTPPSQAHAPILLESLEPRALLAAPYDFAAVGIRFDAGPAVFLTEGTIAADSSITGNTTIATLSAGATTIPIEWTRYNRGPRGAFTFSLAGGFTPYASQTGTQFIADDRWQLGNFVGRDGDGAVRDFAILGEKTDPHTTFAFDLQLARLTLGPLDEPGIEYVPLLVRADSQVSPLTGFTFTYDFASGPLTVHHDVAAVDGGRVTLDDGQVIIFAAPDGNMLLADLNNADGIVGVAAGRMRANAPLPMSGTFRTAVIAAGPESRVFFGALPGETRADGSAPLNVVVRLVRSFTEDPAQPRGTFEVFRQDQWDSGLREPVTTGTWRLALGPSDGSANNVHIELTGQGGRRVTLRQTFQQAFVFGPLTTAAGATEQLLGAGSAQATPAGRPTEFITDVDPQGRPIVYIDIRPTGSLDQALFKLDLAEDVAGEPVVGELIPWTGPGGASFFAGLSASGEIQAWRYDSFGWAFMNITRETPGAHPISGDLFSTRHTLDPVLSLSGPGFQTLAGFDLSGNFVAYRQRTDEEFPSGAAWTFDDAERNGLDGLGDVPTIVGGLSGWDASWGAAHFAGLDSSGNLLAVWWAPGLTRWRVDRLGAPPLVGQVTALRTDWDGFQITGASAADAHVIVTWWAPGRVAWESRDLTSELGGPTLSAPTLTSHYNAGQQTMNIVGADSTGNLRVYWWSPWAGWNIGALTTDPALAPTGPWRMTSAQWLLANDPAVIAAYSQSVLGHDSGNHLTRLVWRSYAPDAWVLEDVTTASQPYFT